MHHEHKSLTIKYYHTELRTVLDAYGLTNNGCKQYSDDLFSKNVLLQLICWQIHISLLLYANTNDKITL